MRFSGGSLVAVALAMSCLSGCGGGSGSGGEPRPVPLPLVEGWPTEIQVLRVEIEKVYEVTFTRADGTPAPVTIAPEFSLLGGVTGAADDGWWTEQPEPGAAELHFTPRGPSDVVVRLGYDVCPLDGETGEDGAPLACAHAVLPGVTFLTYGGATASVRPDVSRVDLVVGERRPVSALTLRADGRRSGTMLEITSGDTAVLSVVDDVVTGVAPGTTTLSFHSGTITETIPVVVATGSMGPPTGLEEPAAAITPYLPPGLADRFRQGRVVGGPAPRVLVEEELGPDRDLLLYAWTGTGWGSERLNEAWRELAPLRYEVDTQGVERLLVRWAHGAFPDEHEDTSVPFVLERGPAAENFTYRRIARWPGITAGASDGPPPAAGELAPHDDAADFGHDGNRTWVATVAWAGARRVLRVTQLLVDTTSTEDRLDEEPCGAAGCASGVPRLDRLELGAPAESGGRPTLLADATLYPVVGGQVRAIGVDEPAFFVTPGAPLLAVDDEAACRVVSVKGAVACGAPVGASSDGRVFVDAGTDAFVSAGGSAFQRVGVRGGAVADDDLAPRLAVLEAVALGRDPLAPVTELEAGWRTARLRGADAVDGELTVAVERDARMFVGTTSFGATRPHAAPEDGGQPLIDDADGWRAWGPIAERAGGVRIALLRARAAAGGARLVSGDVATGYEIRRTLPEDEALAIGAIATGPQGLYVLRMVVGGAEIVLNTGDTEAAQGALGLAPGDVVDRLAVLPGGQLVVGGPAGLWFSPTSGPGATLTSLGVAPSAGLGLAADATGFTVVIAQAGDAAGTGTRVERRDLAGALVDAQVASPALFLDGGLRLGGVDLWPAPAAGGARLVRTDDLFRTSAATELGEVLGAPLVAARSGGAVVVVGRRLGWRDVRLTVRESTDGGATWAAERLLAPALGFDQRLVALAATATGTLATIDAAATLTAHGPGEPAPAPFASGVGAPHVIRVAP